MDYRSRSPNQSRVDSDDDSVVENITDYRKFLRSQEAYQERIYPSSNSRSVQDYPGKDSAEEIVQYYRSPSRSRELYQGEYIEPCIKYYSGSPTSREKKWPRQPSNSPRSLKRKVSSTESTQDYRQPTRAQTPNNSLEFYNDQENHLDSHKSQRSQKPYNSSDFRNDQENHWQSQPPTYPRSSKRREQHSKQYQQQLTVSHKKNPLKFIRNLIVTKSDYTRSNFRQFKMNYKPGNRQTSGRGCCDSCDSQRRVAEPQTYRQRTADRERDRDREPQPRSEARSRNANRYCYDAPQRQPTRSATSSEDNPRRPQQQSQNKPSCNYCNDYQPNKPRAEPKTCEVCAALAQSKARSESRGKSSYDSSEDPPAKPRREPKSCDSYCNTPSPAKPRREPKPCDSCCDAPSRNERRKPRCDACYEPQTKMRSERTERSERPPSVSASGSDNSNPRRCPPTCRNSDYVEYREYKPTNCRNPLVVRSKPSVPRTCPVYKGQTEVDCECKGASQPKSNPPPPARKTRQYCTDSAPQDYAEHQRSNGVYMRNPLTASSCDVNINSCPRQTNPQMASSETLDEHKLKCERYSCPSRPMPPPRNPPRGQPGGASRDAPRDKGKSDEYYCPPKVMPPARDPAWDQPREHPRDPSRDSPRDKKKCDEYCPSKAMPSARNPRNASRDAPRDAPRNAPQINPRKCQPYNKPKSRRRREPSVKSSSNYAVSPFQPPSSQNYSFYVPPSCFAPVNCPERKKRSMDTKRGRSCSGFTGKPTISIDKTRRKIRAAKYNNFKVKRQSSIFETGFTGCGLKNQSQIVLPFKVRDLGSKLLTGSGYNMIPLSTLTRLNMARRMPKLKPSTYHQRCRGGKLTATSTRVIKSRQRDNQNVNSVNSMVTARSTTRRISETRRSSTQTQGQTPTSSHRRTPPPTQRRDIPHRYQLPIPTTNRPIQVTEEVAHDVPRRPHNVATTSQMSRQKSEHSKPVSNRVPQTERSSSRSHAVKKTVSIREVGKVAVHPESGHSLPSRSARSSVQSSSQARRSSVNNRVKETERSPSQADEAHSSPNREQAAVSASAHCRVQDGGRSSAHAQRVQERVLSEANRVHEEARFPDRSQSRTPLQYEPQYSDSTQEQTESDIRGGTHQFYRGSFLTIRPTLSNERSLRSPPRPRGSLIMIAQRGDPKTILKRAIPKGSSFIVPNKWQCMGKINGFLGMNHLVQVSRSVPEQRQNWNFKKICHWLLNGKQPRTNCSNLSK